MSMQRYPSNPIERRKQAVRRYSRNAALWGVGGLGGAAVAGIAVGSPVLVILCLVCAVAGVAFNASRVRTIINHRDLN
ncbi:hypothetical protein CCICO_03865 [Corynebacterium ciconiae DSM 44920]|uniref:hypothetical protein n=1 Tax=Corynebacterium ciconiae TaxID=227319 RepID=UPI0003781347|nr:hypothetical protein [Corynebacterium ciconiae]WKD60810.1 hypothetical protein CCICO_03865 [Corynebacterium ciconiae DSM 44920]